jgi:hypothetical protein
MKITLETAKKLYNAGIRGLAVWYEPFEDWRKGNPFRRRRMAWNAWGPDGLPADWRALGLDEVLAQAVYELEGARDSMTVLYLYPEGYKVERYDAEEIELKAVKIRGKIEGRPVRFRFDHTDGLSLRERVRGLVKDYLDWHQCGSLLSCRASQCPELTVEAVLNWEKSARKTTYWSALEEPLALRFLQGILALAESLINGGHEASGE